MGRAVLRLRRACILLSVTLSIFSCSAAKVYIGVVRARNDYAQGDYQEANRRLIDLRGGNAFDPWIAYNLGTVYYALGEPASAAEVWNGADAGDSTQLAFHLEFNRGVLDYERRDFGSAYVRFRRALELDPSSIAAKVNLEFAAEKLATEDEQPADGAVAVERSPEVGRLLQYLERIERSVWSSSELESDGGRDW